MEYQAIKGARDFYPEQMAVRNRIEQGWREVSLRNGFVEYDGPMLEYLDLFTAKSGEEIVAQLFHLTDRGGRQLALRPEMTPTLARMVNARARSLPLPIKWFSVPRLCRAERPQRGRLREFFQWNIDIIGLDDVSADAETIFVAVDFFREMGLSPAQVEMRVNSRRLVAHMLLDLGFAAEQLEPLYALLDRREKLGPEKFEQALAEVVPDAQARQRMSQHLTAQTLEEVRQARKWSDGTHAAIEELRRIFQWLDCWGVGEYAQFDLSVVRGLAYYTGCVFEAYGKGGLKRALCGGGRYDDLLETLGGPRMPGVGFASSDVVIEDLLNDFGLLSGIRTTPECFVADAAPDMYEHVVRLTGELRQAGLATVFSYRRQNLGKQLKAASEAGCAVALILGEEMRERDVVTLKDLATGKQREVEHRQLLADPRGVIRRRQGVDPADRGAPA